MKREEKILKLKNRIEDYINNEIDSIYSLSPMYLKPSSAERLKK